MGGEGGGEQKPCQCSDLSNARWSLWGLLAFNDVLGGGGGGGGGGGK